MNFEIDRNGLIADRLVEQLQGGAVHVVSYADEGPGRFMACMERATTLGAADRTAHCNRINREDETGTVWPAANLTALPGRFLQQPLHDGEDLRRCLRDAFAANRDFCRCATMVFDFRGGAMNAELIAEETRKLYEDWFDREPLARVVVCVGHI